MLFVYSSEPNVNCEQADEEIQCAMYCFHQQTRQVLQKLSAENWVSFALAFESLTVGWQCGCHRRLESLKYLFVYSYNSLIVEDQVYIFHQFKAAFLSIISIRIAICKLRKFQIFSANSTQKMKLWNFLNVFKIHEKFCWGNGLSSSYSQKDSAAKKFTENEELCIFR